MKVTNLVLIQLIERVTYVIGKDGRLAQAIGATRAGDHPAKALCSI